MLLLLPILASVSMINPFRKCYSIKNKNANAAAVT